MLESKSIANRMIFKSLHYIEFFRFQPGSDIFLIGFGSNVSFRRSSDIQLPVSGVEYILQFVDDQILHARTSERKANWLLNWLFCECFN